MSNPAISLLTQVTRFSHLCATIANVTGTLVVLLMVAIINFDVVARGVFHMPFLGAVEVVQFSMVLIVFLQLPDVVRANRLTRSDGFLIIAGTKFPRVARITSHIIDALSSVFMMLVAFAIWPEFIEMWETNDYFGIPGVFTAPWWPIKLVIFLSAVLCSMIFIIKILSGFLGQDSTVKPMTPQSEV